MSDTDIRAAAPATAVGTTAGLSMPALLLAHAQAAPDSVALRQKHLGRWRQYTWADYAGRVAAVALGLRTLGVQSGDRVAVHSQNSPEWVISDLAIQALGAVTVGIYPTSPSGEVEYLLGHSGSEVLVAEDEEQADKALAVWDRLPDLRRVFVVDTRGVRLVPDRVGSFTEIEALAPPADPIGTLAELVAALDTSAAATIVYTSGTTGPPKGAMLSHANLAAAARNGGHSYQLRPDDEVLSYLPLCHVAERLISEVDALYQGYVVNFGEDSDTFAQDLREVQPTFFLGVPRVWEKLMASVTIRIGDAGWLKRLNYRVWTAVGRRIAARRLRGERLGPLTGPAYGLGWLLLYRPLRNQLGLARVRTALSGAAPIAPEVLRFFWSLGVRVVEGYGQTENTAQATVVPVDDVRIGTVGKVVPGTELRLDPATGEILTRGAATFLGYFKDPEATARTIEPDGWLHTGDVGEVDADGFVKIVDRMKDIIITAGGKNISPSEIENKLKVSPYVREAIVIGDRRKYLSALIGIELDTVGAWALERRVPYTTYADLSRRPEVLELVESIVQAANDEFAQVEQVKRFALLPKELDTEDGEVTATQKVKRRAIEQQFAELIEGMYR